MKTPVWTSWIGLLAVLGLGQAAAADYRPADRGQKPAVDDPAILPDRFLRGFDPITVYFDSDRGPGRGPADDGDALLRIRPTWPGAWRWTDRRTLQFRPAEPWPPLARFQVRAAGERKVLTTMMAAPVAMAPAPGSTELKPFRSLSLTFPQPLDEKALRKMIVLEQRDQPGLANSPRKQLDRFAITALPRRSHRDPAVYALTLPEPVAEGKVLVVRVSLALGDEDKVLWTGRLSTRLPFHVAAVRCGGAHLPLRGDVVVPRDLALGCGHSGETPQLEFSAPVRDLSLTELKKLVRLDPAVADLHFETFGKRVVLRGKFVPDVLYRMRIAQAPITDDSGRPLEDPGDVETFFYLGWKKPFVRWKQGRAILEAEGPRMIPLVGYGEPRVDLRVYRIDPLHPGLWPFPTRPVTVDERADPPFPGEEPEHGPDEVHSVTSRELRQHIRLLGTPLISRVHDLPLDEHGSTTHLGLDIGPLLDAKLGRQRPGHYLVGLRRLTGPPRRAYVRVQVTDLSLTSVEERDRVVFYVRSLSDAEPVAGARLVLEVIRDAPKPKPGERRKPPRIDAIEMRTDRRGRAVLRQQEDWRRVHRLSVRKGEDVLVIDPRDPPPRFANNHWSPWGQWLRWLQAEIPDPANDALLGFVFTERPIYRPGEKVYIKGYARRRRAGRLVAPDGADAYLIRIRAPGGKEWLRPVKFTRLNGFSAEFQDAEAPTGRYTVTLERKKERRVVASRRFRIEAYRIPKFEVQLTGPDRVPNDAPFEVKALARYYAGGSVAGQPIEWTVTRRPYRHVPEGRAGFLFASSLQFSRDGRVRPPETIREQDTLSDKGADTIEVNPALDMDGSARIYRLEATVTGVDNQLVAALHEVRALPPFVLGMKLDRYFDEPTALRPQILALGVDDEPVAGQKVKLRLYRRTWHSHLRETDFSTGKASYVTEKQDEKVFETELVTEKQPVRPSLELEQAGVYVVELSARDELGRVQTLSADLYVGGKEAIAWKKSQQGVFELSTDRKRYAPGDTAKLIIKSPFQRGEALVVVEDPDGHRHRWVPVRGGKAVHAIRIEPHHVPNLPVHVVLMRGRLGYGGDDDSRYRPRTLAASKDLEIEPTANRVHVDVKFPKTARPGSTVDMTIRLRDHRKRPLAGEVTLWLVDEAVLALAPEASLDPLDTLIRRNRRTTSVRDTRNRVVGRLREREEPAGDGGPGDDRDRLRGKRRVRKNFETVPYYQATLEVGPEGVLRVPVKLSDDLTNFQVRAVAASAMKRFGWFHKRLKVRLPIIVQPQLPRFARQGDRFLAGGIGRLVEGAEGPGRVAVRFGGDVSAKDAEKRIALKRNRAESHLWPITAAVAEAGQPGSIQVRMEIARQRDGVGDAFEVQLPVLPDRTEEHQAVFLSLKSGAEKLPPLPEKPRPGTVRQKLLVSSVPGVTRLLAGLDYLARYPHGCLEQRLSSLVAQLQVAGGLKRLGLNEHYAMQVGEHVERMLEQLKAFQNDRGFFAFWPGAAGSVMLTAQAVEFMDLARRKGHAVPAAQFDRAVEALARVLRSDFVGLRAGYRFNQQTTALRALVRVGRLDEHYALELFHNLDDLDLTSIADLGLSMLQRADLFKRNLGQLRKRLWSRVVFELHRGERVYKGLTYYRRRWTGWVIGSNLSALSAVFESLVRLDPGDERLVLLRDALLGEATAVRGFGNTHENRRAIQALLTYMDKADTTDVAARVTVRGDGALELGDGVKIAQRSFSDDQPLSLEVETEGELLARVLTSYLPAAPGHAVEPRAQGLIVSRRSTVFPADDSQPQVFEDEAGAKRALAPGDILEIEARLVNQSDMHHVALIVPFAAGLEPLNPELATATSDAKPSRADSRKADYVQRLDHEVRYYFIDLPKGNHSFFFRVRAATPGSFVHPAPWAEQMYHQDVRGRGAGMRIAIER
jgi:hypothetical protein